MGKILGNQAIHDVRDWNQDDWGDMFNNIGLIGIDPIGGTAWAVKSRVQAGTRREEQEARDREEQAKRDAAARAEAGRQEALGPIRDEYKKRFDEMSKQRTLDLSALKGRLQEWGFGEDSLAWKTGMQTIFATYEDKLKTLGSDPYFDQIEKTLGWT